MPLTTAFRLSFFVTLGLACTCLALAETFFLWWMGLFLIGTIVLLGLAYRWEGIWVLSADAANRLGMVIAIGAAFWILYKLPRNEEELLAAGVPWPAGLLPHLGPLLIVLLLVKLFRPKRLSDYWVIQTIGLMMVTLACVLAAEPLFGVLLVAYLAALVWSLALFYLVREEACSRTLAPGTLSLFTALEPAALPLLPWRHLGLGRVARWSALVVVCGLALFLVAPRHDNSQWEPKQLASAAKGIIKTGFEGGMDLNRTGKIEVSDDPAFEVQAMDKNGPKRDLNPETRWNLQTLDYYSQGRWTSWGQAAPPHLTWGISPKPEPLALPAIEGRLHPRDLPSDLADSDYYLAFKIRLSAAGGLPLAEPIAPTGQPARLRLGLFPHLGDSPVEMSFYFQLVGTDSILASTQGRRRIYHYGQVVPTLPDPSSVPMREVLPRYRHFLINQDVPEVISAWVHNLLGNLPDLTTEDRHYDAKGRLPAAVHAKVAQALTRYLAFSGDFGYSLDLSRQQLHIDPLADFLLNVKEGHCERFAGGLTLMLRSVGIPARVVKGYRGAEQLDQGLYLIRQSQAHSWVQALVDVDTDPRWLTLDPTPSTERANKLFLSWLGWLFLRWNESDNLWRSFVMEYNADQQGRALENLRHHLTPENPWSVVKPALIVGSLLLAMIVGLRVRRRWFRPVLTETPATSLVLASLGAGFYPRFLEVARRLLHLEPQPGQTPQEFGLLARSRLETLDLERAAAIPQRLVSLLYRVRFGGQTLTDAEKHQANEAVSTLEASLQGLPAQV